MASSSPEELWAYTRIYRTCREVIRSANYDPIPLFSCDQVLNATHPIPMDFLRHDLSGQQRQDVYSHIVETVEPSNQSASYLEAVEITKNALVAIHLEEMTELTSTTDTSETASYTTANTNTSTLRRNAQQGIASQRQLYMIMNGSAHSASGRQTRMLNSIRPQRVNDSAEQGRDLSRVPSSGRSVSSTCSTTQAQGRLTPSSSTVSAWPASASSTLDTTRAEVGSTLSSSRGYRQAIRSNSSSVYEDDTASMADSAHAAASTASSSIKIELMELDRRLNELDDLLDEYDEPRTLKEARQASRTARRAVFQARSSGGALQEVLLEAQQKTTVAERIAEHTLTGMAIRASMSTTALPEEQSAQSEQSRLGEQVAGLIDMARDIRLEAGQSHANPRSSPRVNVPRGESRPPPYDAPTVPRPDYAPPAYQAIPNPEGLPVRQSRLHYIDGSCKSLVCQCSDPYGHQNDELAFVRNPEIREKCTAYFRRNPGALHCTKAQWRTVDVDDTEHRASDQAESGSSSSNSITRPLEGGRGLRIGSTNIYASKGKFTRRRN